MVNIQKSIKEINSIEKQGSVISLYCGYGANTIGYKLAGLNVKVAVDKNGLCQKVYTKNHPDTVFILKDIRNIKGEELLSYAGLDKYELDILDASPPSDLTAKPARITDNQRDDNDFIEIGRIIEETMPKVFIINHHKKLLTGKTRLYLNEILELYEEIGYRISLETLDASVYEVPQKRERAIIIGVRKDLNIKPVYPEALEKTITTKEAIEDLIDRGLEGKIKSKRDFYIKEYFRPGCTSKEVKEIAKIHNINVRGANYKRDRWDSVYYELMPHTTRPYHPKVDRVLSIWEALRLQTFPDDYSLSGYKHKDWKNVCKSIPPNLIKHIANTIKLEILEKLF